MRERPEKQTKHHLFTIPQKTSTLRQKKDLKFTSINTSSDSLIMTSFPFTTTRIFICSTLFALSALLVPIFYKPLHPASNGISSFLNYFTATHTETFNATMTGKKTVAYFVNWVRVISNYDCYYFDGMSFVADSPGTTNRAFTAATTNPKTSQPLI